MGLRGPASAPSALKLLRGNPGKRALPKDEPRPTVVEQSIGENPPEHLPEVARKWWAYYATILRDMRVLTAADLVALEGLAIVTTQRIEQEVMLAQAGTLYKAKTGSIMVSPQFYVVGMLRDRELKLLREFGLTPSSRTKVQSVAAQAKPENRFSKFRAS